MAAAKRFEELEVWQTARRLARGVYRACRVQPLRHDQALANQMRRAAVSTGSNIAERLGRRALIALSPYHVLTS
jgi:hypothetical protein